VTGVVADGVPMSKILGIVDITKIDNLPELYTAIVKLKKDVYEDNERIVIRYGNYQQTLELVKEILKFVDIPDFFVIYEFVDISQGLNFKLSNSHCVYPWINLEVGHAGDIRPCCNYNGNISHNSKSISKISENTIKEIYLNDYMDNLRSKFIAGERPAECNACWDAEFAGIPSMRQSAKHKFREIYYAVDYQKKNFNHLQTFDLKLGNNCNLSCNICSPSASSKIAKKQLESKIISLNEYKQIQLDARWADSNLLEIRLSESIYNIKYLDLYGGEPLMSNSHFKFLKKLIDLNVANYIKLDYNTNGTVYSDKFFELWDHFKEVKLSFSIDDIEDRFEEQRCGALWDTVSQNIIRYHKKKSKKFITEVFPTINTQNVYWLPELQDWIATQSFDYVSYNILHIPAHYNILSLSKEDKLITIEKLKNYPQYEICNSIIKLLGITK